MPAPALPPLAEWENFYVIMGSSAAVLTGLMFVVIALGAEARAVSSSATLRAFATPTIMHFGAVVLLAAFLTMPRHTIASLSACLLASAVGGLVYASWVIVQARQQKAYMPVLSDWVWHAGLPVVAYASLFVAGVLLWRSAEVALYVVGATALLLLYIGIHNAWDSLVSRSLRSRRSRRASAMPTGSIAGTFAGSCRDCVRGARTVRRERVTPEDIPIETAPLSSL